MPEPTAPGDAGSELQARFDVVPGTGPQPATVRAAGDIDLISAPQFQAALTEAAAGTGEVTVDMTAVTYCDSAAIHALFTAARQGRVTLVIPEDGPINTLLKIVGLDQIATVITAR
jgi:anti-sigma B factor antagonist